MDILTAPYYSLSEKVNKFPGNENSQDTKEGVVSDKLPELTLDMPNEDLGKLVEKWEKSWKESEVYSEWQKHSKENEEYWRGKHFNQPQIDSTRPLVDNVIFEALETYLPQVTRRNPDPMVTLDADMEQTEENEAFAKNLQKELGEIADEQRLRLKLKGVARNWAIYMVGVVKLGWDLDLDMPTAKVLRPTKIILDPDSTVDENGYTGRFIGEHKKMEAKQLIDMLAAGGGEQGSEEIIKGLVKEDLGTDIGFIEWWTDQYMCWTIGRDVLLKKKNPHWNYEKEVPPPMDEFGNQPMNEDGTPMMEKEMGVNHFEVPYKPYLFLSIFNLGKQPVDVTSLIGQNLSNQDVINKRIRQIDKNADSQNNGIAVSLERSGLTKDQARGISDALKNGGTIAIPQGDIGSAVQRLPANPIPGQVYEQAIDLRNRTRDIFGTRGSSAAGLESETTVRGKLQNRALDTDRMGGGITEYLEQMADDIYNWFVQLLYVYDDDYVGKQLPEVKISVKEGSLLPKDSTTIANQALELAGMGKMSTVDLYKRLDYPNPEELAANVWLETNAPDVLYGSDPRVQQVMQMKAQQDTQEKPPSESISYKDLPPDAQAQMLAKVGIKAHPEAIAAYDEATAAKEAIAAPLPVIPK